MNKKKIMIYCVSVVVLLAVVLGSWRIGYSMGGKDELKRIQMQFKEAIDKEKTKPHKRIESIMV